jgi:hypothetical protein
MFFLQKLSLIDKDMNVNQFWQGILKFIQTNMNKFLGMTRDGSDCAYQSPWGEAGNGTKKRSANSSQNPAATRETYTTTEVMNGIWNRCTDYTKKNSYGNWMGGDHVISVIASMYKIPRLVMYNNSLLMDGCCVFKTYIFTYDENIPLVTQ